MNVRDIKRSEALELLSRLHITGNEVYLLDLVPVAAMCWADGHLDPVELEVLRRFMRRRVDEVNQDAGSRAISYEEGERFLARFTKEPGPPKNFLRLLCGLLKPVALSNSDPARNQRRRQAIIGACLEVAAAASVPGASQEQRRISPEEHRWFDEVSAAL